MFKRFGFFVLVLAVLSVMIAPAAAQGSAQEVSLWFHSGQGSERDALNTLIDGFNSSQSDYVIAPQEVPEGSYNDQVRAAALAGTLPCVLDFDGPFIYSYVYAGDLIPIDSYFDKATLDDVLPSIIAQGTVNGKLYSLGQFDSGLAIWGNKSLLDAANVTIPTDIKDAWTLDQFNAALAALKDVVPSDGYVLDLEFQNTGEWYSYAFGPIIRSFGGDTIDRSTYKTAEGVLNGPEAVAAMTWFQSLFTDGYATATPVDPNADFEGGKVALSYVGHWMYPDYKKALGDNLVLIPMPNFGKGAVTGMGSWNWGITAGCSVPDGAAAFINYLIQPDNVLTMTKANGAIPARISALDQDPNYEPGGDLYIYREQLENGIAVPRAQTAVYPTISTAMETAVTAIARGDDVQSTLDDAVDSIDNAIANQQSS
jgi:multiple sugar transport system substrate-binding protein